MHTADKLEYDRLYFRPSTKIKGKFVARIKRYKDNGTGKQVHDKDEIVVANEGSGVLREGKWDVKVKRMKKGDGYVVLSARLAEDRMSMKRERYCVVVMINGREDKLVCQDGAILPLSFSSKKYYDPDKIGGTIRRKAEYLQLNPAFDLTQFIDLFIAECKRVYQEYLVYCKENTEERKPVNLSSLKQKYEKR